jgi:outer membrane protein assembly factor BamB
MNRETIPRGRRPKKSPWAVTGLVVLAAAAAGCAGVSGRNAASGSGSPGAQVLAVRTAGGRATTPTSLTTYHYDNARDGVGPASPGLSHLVQAWSNENIQGAVYAEPLIYGGVVLVATENDYLYALSVKTGAIAWHVKVGAPAQSSSVQAGPGLASCGDVYPLGITGTPVIDTAKDVLYLAAEEQRPGTTSWKGIGHFLVAISLSHHRILWQKSIDPPGYGDGSGTSYVIAAEQQRSGLTLANGRVYVEFGGLAGDCSAYHGFVVSRADTGAGGLSVYKTPSPREDAIWATSGAVVDGKGQLFVATGNGANGPGQRFDFGDAVIKLSPGLRAMSYFAPSSWAYLNNADLDIGSDGPTLLPGGKYIFQSGKAGYASGDGGSLESWGYLLSVSSLGGIGHPLFQGQVCPDAGFVYGANAAATVKISGVSHTVVYVPCPSGTVALEVVYGKRLSFHRIWEASNNAPNGPPIVAGGLVWAVSTGADGDTGPSNVLSGMSLVTGKVVVTRQIGPVENFSTPAVADGLLVIGTASGVEAYKS